MTEPTKPRMRIFVVSGYGYWGDFKPDDLRKGEKQIGGGETAMISISRELAAMGHEVVTFYDVNYPTRYEGVDYVPTNLFVPMVCQLEHDVLIAWDNTYAFRFNDRAKIHVAAFQLNDAHVGVHDHSIDMYMHPSKWHAERFHALYPEMTASKSRMKITNGIDPHRFVQEVPREPHRVIYSSSPDRGLHHVLRFWPKVREAVPDAELHVFYEIDNWIKMVRKGATAEVVSRADQVEAARNANMPGVFFHGGIGQMRLAREQLMSAVMAYACDPVQPTEGFSMTCLEAITAGCSLVTTDADALRELWADAPDVTILPLPVADDVWVDTIVKLLNRTEERIPKAPRQYFWATVAQRWEQELLAAL